MKDPAVVKRAMEMGIHILGGSPDNLGQRIREGIAKFAKFVKDANIPQEQH